MTTRCSHKVPLESPCAQCTAEGMAAQPIAGEHLVKVTLEESEYYPDHPPRTESPTFRQTKRDGKKRGMRCAISGQLVGLEYHHIFCEEADMLAVCWQTMKGIGTGEITELPVLDLVTDQPTGEMAPATHFLCYWLVKIAAARGFDWAAFDPEKPDTFVDALENMLVLNEKYHRAKNHGIHMKTFPTYVMQALPRKQGFVYTADELPASTHPTA